MSDLYVGYTGAFPDRSCREISVADVIPTLPRKSYCGNQGGGLANQTLKWIDVARRALILILFDVEYLWISSTLERAYKFSASAIIRAWRHP